MEGKALANQIWETLSRAGVAGIVAFVRHCCSVGACGATLRCNEKGRRKVGLQRGVWRCAPCHQACDAAFKARRLVRERMLRNSTASEKDMAA